MEQAHPKKGVDDASSAVSGVDTSSGSDSGGELEDELDSNYDPLWD